MERLLLALVLTVNLGLFQHTRSDKISINLPVLPLKQLKLTSCGEAVFAMAYHYVYPKTFLDERDVLTYAEAQGYYNEKKWPFTSPANMVKITRHYTKDFATGVVSNSNEGLSLLVSNIQSGSPIMIDILSQLDDPYSGAHFVLVTGIKIPEDNKYAVTVYYNDPLTGRNRSAPWYGDSGVWNAWRNNGDPGGAGWWLLLRMSAPDLP